MTNKKRLDVAMVERGLAESRQKAQAIIMAGQVYVDDQKVDKAGAPVKEEQVIQVRGKTLRYVSRGGLKLEKAMACWPISLDGTICADIGASTGGFTDCMLQNGASKVYAVDVGYNQLDYRLRTHPQVVCMERTNARYLTGEQIPEPLDFFSVDVAFISLRLILPPMRPLVREGAQAVCLVKPQFEAGRGKVGKNGVVREPQIHEEVIRKIIDYADSIGFEVLHLEYSPIKGPEGNIEYLLHIRKPEEISEEKLALTEHEAESALQTIIEEKTGLSYTPEWDAVIKGIVDNSHTL